MAVFDLPLLGILKSNSSYITFYYDIKNSISLPYGRRLNKTFISYLKRKRIHFGINFYIHQFFE
jgi:hypothetical protein